MALQDRENESMSKLAYAMNDDQWRMLVQDAADFFDDVTIKRGYQYYKQGRVGTLTLPAPREILAVVEGTDSYRVALNLDFFTLSSCDCPVNGNCKHMVAVMLAYADQQGRSIHALVNAKSGPIVNAYANTAANAHRQQAQEDRSMRENLAKLEAAAGRIAELPVSEWHDYMSLCTAPLERMVRNSSYATQAKAAIRTTAHQLPGELELLFELHIRLFLIEKLVKPTPAPMLGYAQDSFIGYQTQVAIEGLQEEIESLFDQEPAIAVGSKHGALMEETIDWLRRRMLARSSLQAYLAPVYYQLWELWVGPHASGAALYIEELRKLAQAEEELGKNLARDNWLLAQGWMHYYIGQDQEAWAVLREASGTEHLLGYLNDLLGKEDWPRLAAWLTEIGPMLHTHRRGTLLSYYQYWERLLEVMPEAEPSMLDACVRMLPYSAGVYEELLLSRGRWQDWIDYQLTRGSEPLDYRVSVLQPIEKEAPSLLLPFYHQAVERYVLLKNRAGYKAAVKLLKRLAKLYAKLKQSERWEAFLYEFTSRHSRLRALNEELRKGKLIP
jgi:hypothetical protein